MPVKNRHRCRCYLGWLIPKDITLFRSGFTLIELLVVIAIVGVLMGLLLSAVMQVRAASARTVCTNQLRQIGLALHGYHDTQGSLPPGVSYLQGKSPQPFMSWHTRILPFVEQEGLWRNAVAAYQTKAYFQDNPPHTGMGTVVKLYTCPADSRTHQPALLNNRPYACTDYLGVNGTNYLRQDGLLFVDSRIRFTDIKDGLTNTLLVGERPPSSDYVYGWWYAGEGMDKDGSADTHLGVRERYNGFHFGSTCGLGPYHFQRGKDTDPCSTFHFWSHHPGGAHFLYAGGAVSFFTYSSNSILPALATRAGGEPAEVP